MRSYTSTRLRSPEPHLLKLICRGIRQLIFGIFELGMWSEPASLYRP